MTLISSRGGQGCNVGTFNTGHGKERVAQSELGYSPPAPPESELLFCGTNAWEATLFFFAVLAFSPFLAGRISDCKVRGRATPAPASNRSIKHKKRRAPQV